MLQDVDFPGVQLKDLPTGRFEGEIILIEPAKVERRVDGRLESKAAVRFVLRDFDTGLIQSAYFPSSCARGIESDLINSSNILANSTEYTGARATLISERFASKSYDKDFERLNFSHELELGYIPHPVRFHCRWSESAYLVQMPARR